MFSNIFSPIKVNQLELPNRLIVPAMLTKLNQTDGFLTEDYIAYHARKAEGGWGLIITGDYAVVPEGRSYAEVPGLWCDEQIAANQKLTEAVHQRNGRIFVQLFHAGRVAKSSVIGTLPAAPSLLRDASRKEDLHVLTCDEIEDLVLRFGDAAFRAQKAGFDGVEIHGGHGYLINQFLSPHSNKRSDAYGGSLENRARLAVEIVKEVRRRCGREFPLSFRISVEEYVPDGLKAEETAVIAEFLERAGVDMINCSQGIHESNHFIIAPSAVPERAFLKNANAIKEKVGIPVAAVGRITDPYVAEQTIRIGKADMIAMGRMSLADPDFPKKLKENRLEEVRPCIGCLQGCSEPSVRCLVNPFTGMEARYHLKPIETPKKVMVVGGGVAGCEAAILCASRGFQVQLFEKSDKLGGQWELAAVPLGKTTFISFLRWQKQELKRQGVSVFLNTAVTEELVKEQKPDAVIFAVGSDPVIPKIPGMEDGHVVTAADVLSGEVLAGDRVVVIGGGLVGVETADFLAYSGRDVTVVEMMDKIAPDAEKIPMHFLNERLEEKKVRLLTGSKVTKIEANGVTVEREGVRTEFIDTDTVVLAVGRRPSNGELLESLRDLEVPIYVIGDASKVKNGCMNIREAAEIALKL